MGWECVVMRSLFEMEPITSWRWDDEYTVKLMVQKKKRMNAEKEFFSR